MKDQEIIKRLLFRYYNLNELKRVVRFTYGDKLNVIVNTSNNLTDIIIEVYDYYNSRGNINPLLTAAKIIITKNKQNDRF